MGTGNEMVVAAFPTRGNGLDRARVGNKGVVGESSIERAALYARGCDTGARV